MSEPDPTRRSKVPFAWLVAWVREQWRRHHPFVWLLDWWRREWRRTAVILLALAAVLLVVRGVANVWIGHQLNEEVSRLEKLYGRLDMASLAPPYVPPAENRARVVRAAASLLVVGHTEMGTLVRRFTARPTPGFPPLTTEELRRVVDLNQLALQVAERARRRARSDWEIDYANDEGNFRGLLDVRNLGIVLAMSCRADIDAGRADAAGGAALAGLAEAASLRQEPNLLIQLIRISVASEQFRCVRDLLGRGEPSAPLLSDLAAALAENPTPDGMHLAYVGELKHVNHLFGQMERGNVGDYVGITPGPRWAGPVGWVGRPLIRQGHLRALRTIAGIAETQSVPPFARRASDAAPLPRSQRATPRWWDAIVKYLRRLQFARRFDEMFTAGLERTGQGGYEYLSELNAAQLAVALRRFRLDRGTYPDALADLAPQYLARVPADPFTGRPPEYVRQGAGFELRAHGAPGTTSDLLEWKIPR